MQTRRKPLIVRLSHALAACLCTLLCALVGPDKALAHPDLDAAIERAQDADFEAALVAFNAALSSGTLTRDELVTLLSERSIVLHALGKSEALSYDLAYLALIAPGHRLGRGAPPALIDHWEQAQRKQGAGLALDATCEPGAAGVHIEAHPNGLHEASLGQVILFTRVDGQEWVQKRVDHADMAADHETIAYYAEVRGLGDVVLARIGSSDEPLGCELATGESPSFVGPNRDQASRRSSKLWWWIGGASAVAVAAVATAVIVSARSDGKSDDTVVSKPMVSF